MPITDEHIKARRAAAAELRRIATTCQDAADQMTGAGPRVDLCSALASAGAALETLALELAAIIRDQNGQGAHNRITRKGI